MMASSKENAFETVEIKTMQYQGGNIMLKKLFKALKNVKKENNCKAMSDYQKKFGCYTAGYRH